MSDKLCGNCAYRSDGINALSYDYCYCFDKQVVAELPGCEEWRGSLRDEPVGFAPLTTPFPVEEEG